MSMKIVMRAKYAQGILYAGGYEYFNTFVVPERDYRWYWACRHLNCPAKFVTEGPRITTPLSGVDDRVRLLGHKSDERHNHPPELPEVWEAKVQIELAEAEKERKNKKAVPVHISHAVPLPIRHAVPVPYHQPYPVPVRQPIPYAVPVPIPYPVHQNGPHYAAGAAGYGAIAAGLGPAYLGHPQAGSVAIKHAGLHAAPPYHLPHHHLGLAGHHRLVHAPAQAWAGGHRLVPPPVYLGHDFSGGQQHGLHYGHHHHHHHQLLSHGHVGHAGLLAASAEPHYHSQRSVKDEKTTSTSTKKDKRSKLKAETKNVDDRDEHETENDNDEN